MAKREIKIENNEGISGVYYEISNKVTFQNRPAKIYRLRYKLGKRTITESLGIERKANPKTNDPGMNDRIALSIRQELIANWKRKEPPFTYKEMMNAKEKTAHDIVRMSNTVLDDLFPGYLPLIESKNKKKKAESHYKNYIKPLLGHVPIAELGDFSHWSKLKALLLKMNRKQQTRYHVASSLNDFLKYLKDKKKMIKFKVSLTELGFEQVRGMSNERTAIFSESQRKQLMKELKKKNIHAYYITRFAFLTACRFNEAASLKWTEIDHDQESIRFVDTKAKKDHRISLTPNIKKLLKEMEQDKNFKQHDTFVFPDEYNRKYPKSPWSFDYVVSKTLKFNHGRKGRHRFVFHSIRHTVLSWLAKQDSMTLSRFMAISGHNDVSNAMRYVKHDYVQQMKDMTTIPDIAA